MRLKEVKFLRKIKSSKVKKLASLFLAKEIPSHARVRLSKEKILII